ncbi:MAG: HlyC/CorC family transporter [Candidatus Abyssobacteria bacterium SURF_17]|uniref:HlyC/CorC family transporter n=1 Tax=Candidatus Abyssobacteria bacterium SURF_17 TaxID=2093361 RepID=A0A419ERR5_9BACT|nr:MAG: HlyC/CorC family transporter [Candidatus Abyssubacteria bacterium SURF_17]
MSVQFIEHLFLLLILLGVSFFFSGSETALFSLPRVVIERLKQTSISGRHVANLLEEPNRLLVTILIGNLAANILISEIVALWTLRLLRPLPYSVYLGSLMAIFISTTLLLLFGEVAPKTLAINNAERFAHAVAIPLSMFARAAYPILRLFQFLADAILHVFGVRKGEPGAVTTEEELKTMLEMGEEEGILRSSERLMIHRIFEFGDTLVRDVFVPRADAVRVKYDITVEQLAAIMRESGHSRFPVYGKTVDDIKGIVYAKDLFPYYWRGQTNIPISRFIRPAYYVPETKKVRDLLREFQTGRMHMAIVVGEYGGTRGIVTLEDLIEEVVGEIFDEYDVKKAEVERLPDGTFRVNAALRLDDLSDVIGAHVRGRDCDTVGGLIYEILERVPSLRDHVEYGGFRFEVEDIRGRRIRSVLVTPLTASKQKGKKA